MGGTPLVPVVGHTLDVAARLGRFSRRFPECLIDVVLDHEPGRRLVASKNLTVGEEFFQGHFPSQPLMPAVLMVEALAQAAAVLVLEHESVPAGSRVTLRGVNDGKFRRGVVPGDTLRLEVSLTRLRSRLAVAQAGAYVGDQVVAEARLLLTVEPAPPGIHPSAIVDPRARVGAGTTGG